MFAVMWLLFARQSSCSSPDSVGRPPAWSAGCSCVWSFSVEQACLSRRMPASRAVRSVATTSPGCPSGAGRNSSRSGASAPASFRLRRPGWAHSSVAMLFDWPTGNPSNGSRVQPCGCHCQVLRKLPWLRRLPCSVKMGAPQPVESKSSEREAAWTVFIARQPTCL